MPKLFLLPAARGKWAFIWGALFFLAAQMVLAAYLNGQRPELRDPAFGIRLRSLQKRLADNPDAPLVVVLGSSRVLNGLSPAHMPLSLNGEGPPPLVYNFAFMGSGSIRELMMYRRLRAAGIKPDWLLIETWPVLWPQDGIFAERRTIAEEELYWSDLGVLARCQLGKLELFGHALKGNLVPLLCYRSRLLHAGARRLLPREQARGLSQEDDDWTSSDGTGWLPCRKIPANRAAQRREVEKGLWVAAPLLNPLRIAPDSDRALRELLQESWAEGIKIALLLMPEHSECRRWYSPKTHALVSAYLQQMSVQYACPVIDARTWSPDEHFADFAHMAPCGVQPFSERFARGDATLASRRIVEPRRPPWNH